MRLATLLLLLSASALAQPVTYQVSCSAVTSGPVLVPAFTFQYVSDGFLQTNTQGLFRLIGQPGFSMNPTLPNGLVLMDAVFFPNGGAPYFSLAFANGNTTLLIDLRPQPGASLLIATTYELNVFPNLLTAGAQPVAGTPGKGTLLISTTSLAKPVLSVSPASLALTFRPAYPPPEAPPIVVTTDPPGVSFTAEPSDRTWMQIGGGTTPATIRPLLFPYSLAPGVYTNRITITAPAANPSTVVVTLTLTVTERGPFVYLRQVSNSASYASVAAQNGGIAQGSIFVLFGNSIGPTVLTQAGYPLPTELAKTSVRIRIGSNSVDALVVYVSAEQTAAILPSRTPLGDGTVTVTYDGTESQPYPIRVVPTALGVYTATSNGLGQGVITGADFQMKTIQSPARPGETLILWGTGLGAIDGDESTRPTPASRFSTQVFAGGKQAKVTYAGRAGCCSGLDQINFEVPDAISGCFVPVAARTGDVTSNFTTLPVSNSGPCSDPYGFPSDLMIQASRNSTIKLGLGVVGPLTILYNFGFPPNLAVARRLSAALGRSVDPRDVAKLLATEPKDRTQVAVAMAKKYGVRTVSQARRLARELRIVGSDTSEGFIAWFSSMSNLAASVPQFGSMFPPPGSCTVIQDLPTTSRSAKGQVTPLDVGPRLTLTSPAGTSTLVRGKRGMYQAVLGTHFAPLQAPPGSYTLSGTGGADFASFSTSMRVSNTLAWANKSAISRVDRSQPLTVTWSGGPASGHVVFGGHVHRPADTAFLCTESTAKGSLTVPQHVLSAMPAARQHDGYVFLAPHPLESRFAIPGLDIGFFLDLSTDGKAIEFR